MEEEEFTPLAQKHGWMLLSDPKKDKHIIYKHPGKDATYHLCCNQLTINSGKKAGTYRVRPEEFIQYHAQ